MKPSVIFRSSCVRSCKMTAHQRSEEVEPEQREEAGAQDGQQVVIAAGHDAIDDRAGEDRHGQREDLEDQRQHRGANPGVGPAHGLPQIARIGFSIRSPLSKSSPGSSTTAMPVNARARDRRFECDGVRRTGRRPRFVVRHALEDNEVIELPVEDRSHGEILELLDLELHAARLQAKCRAPVTMAARWRRRD